MASQSGEMTVVTLAPLPPGIGSCQLCASGNVEITTVVQAQQSSGGAVAFEACASCTRALRRLAAASRGFIRFTDGSPGPIAAPLMDTTPLHPERVLDYQEPTIVGDGTVWQARAMGAERADGTYIGWIEFADPTTGLVRRTDRETTQPNRPALVYWASGLQGSYLEGAFRRATTPQGVRWTA